MREGAKRAALAVLAVCGFYAVLALLDVTCPIKWLTGVSCPGCGMTRALLAALRLDFASAVHYHPLFWLPPVALVGYLVRDRVPKGTQKAALWTACGLLIAAYVLRLVTRAAPDVVAWAPPKGAIFRFFSRLKG